MAVLLKRKRTNKTGAVLTIGIFDGVHVGHRKILDKVVRAAGKKGLRSAALTFYPHPSGVLLGGDRRPMLVSLTHRVKLLSDTGIDTVYLMKFDKHFSLISAGDFVREIIVREINAKEIYVGDNFYFGRGREGDIEFLKKEAGIFGIKVHVVKAVKKNGVPVSSTLIRHLIMSGELSKASALLGRDFSLLGTVIYGDRRGRELGFPTANMNLHHEVTPPSGVYAVIVNIDGKYYDGIVNIGFRPTFKKFKGEKLVEVHVLHFSRQIYGKDIEAVFIKKLRQERRFKSRESLINRIMADIKQAKKVLAAKKNH